jgi:hypothetical protein
MQAVGVPVDLGRNLFTLYMVMGFVFLAMPLFLMGHPAASRQGLTLFLVGIVWFLPLVIWLVQRDYRLKVNESDALQTWVRRKQDVVWIRTQVRVLSITLLALVLLLGAVAAVDQVIAAYAGPWKEMLRRASPMVITILAFAVFYWGIGIWMRRKRMRRAYELVPGFHTASGDLTPAGRECFRAAFAFWQRFEVAGAELFTPRMVEEHIDGIEIDGEFVGEWEFSSKQEVAFTALSMISHRTKRTTTAYLSTLHDEQSVSSLLSAIDEAAGGRLGTSKARVYWEPMVFSRNVRLHVHELAWAGKGKWTTSGSPQSIRTALVRLCAERDRWHGGSMRLAVADGVTLIRIPDGCIEPLTREFPPEPHGTIEWADNLALLGAAPERMQ